REGEVLSANPGAWKNAPSSYNYQWERCDSKGNNCTSIVGATARRYTLTSDDVNHHMRITVTAHNSAGSASAISAQSSLVTAGGPRPRVELAGLALGDVGTDRARRSVEVRRRGDLGCDDRIAGPADRRPRAVLAEPAPDTYGVHGAVPRGGRPRLRDPGRARV